MITRLVVAAIFIPIIVAVVLLLPPVALCISFSILSAIGVYELVWSTGLLKHPRLLVYAIAFAALIPIWAYLGSPPEYAALVLFLYVLILFLEAMFGCRAGFSQISGSFFASLIIPFFFSSFVRVGFLPFGRIYTLMIFLFPFVSDAGGYFVGIRFGRRKLAPEISPHKTVEGSLGCFLGSVLGTLVFGIMLSLLFSYTVNYGVLLLYAVVGSAVSQVGDLAFSFIKREFGLKDFGNLFPGHGGVLDRFDSVLFAAPLLEILYRILPALS